MSSLANHCQFCENKLDTKGECSYRCDEKIQDELSKLDIDNNFSNRKFSKLSDRSFLSIIHNVTHDKSGNNWKYDSCDFCKKHCHRDHKISFDDISYNFCSSNCMIATMGRIYNKAVKSSNMNHNEDDQQ